MVSTRCLHAPGSLSTGRNAARPRLRRRLLWACKSLVRFFTCLCVAVLASTSGSGAPDEANLALSKWQTPVQLGIPAATHELLNTPSDLNNPRLLTTAPPPPGGGLPLVDFPYRLVRPVRAALWSRWALPARRRHVPTGVIRRQFRARVTRRSNIGRQLHRPSRRPLPSPERQRRVSCPVRARSSSVLGLRLSQG